MSDLPPGRTGPADRGYPPTRLLRVTAVLGPDFDTFIWSYIFWVPWDRVARRVLGSHPRWHGGRFAGVGGQGFGVGSASLPGD